MTFFFLQRDVELLVSDVPRIVKVLFCFRLAALSPTPQGAPCLLSYRPAPPHERHSGTQLTSTMGV